MLNSQSLRPLISTNAKSIVYFTNLGVSADLSTRAIRSADEQRLDNCPHGFVLSSFSDFSLWLPTTISLAHLAGHRGPRTPSLKAKRALTNRKPGTQKDTTREKDIVLRRGRVSAGRGRARGEVACGGSRQICVMRIFLSSFLESSSPWSADILSHFCASRMSFLMPSPSR